MKILHAIQRTAVSWLFPFAFILFLFTLPACSEDDVDDVELDLQLVADGFTSPIGLVSVPDNSNRLFVIDQAGKIWIIDGQGMVLPQPFLDITSEMVSLSPGYDERGLIGFTFHPSTPRL